MLWTILLLGCTQSPLDTAQESETSTGETEDEIAFGRFPGAYLMAMFSCDGSICMDPAAFNHEVWIMYSDDGETWNLPEPNEPFSGSVPDLIRRDNTLYVYGGRGTVRRYHFDTDTWEDPVPNEQTGDYVHWDDISPVMGDDGLLHLFFLASDISGEPRDPAECPETSTTPCTQRFRSAIEVEGSDGALFEVQEDSRLEISLNPGERSSDPDVFRLVDGRWGMYITWLKRTALFVSDDLHGTYEPAEELGMPPFLGPPDRMVASGFYNEQTGQYWTYADTPLPLSSGFEVGIQRAVHDDVNEVLNISDFETVVRGGDESGLPSGYWAASPGITLNQP